MQGRFQAEQHLIGAEVPCAQKRERLTVYLFSPEPRIGSKDGASITNKSVYREVNMEPQLRPLMNTFEPNYGNTRMLPSPPATSDAEKTKSWSSWYVGTSENRQSRVLIRGSHETFHLYPSVSCLWPPAPFALHA